MASETTIPDANEENVHIQDEIKNECHAENTDDNSQQSNVLENEQRSNNATSVDVEMVAEKMLQKGLSNEKQNSVLGKTNDPNFEEQRACAEQAGVTIESDSDDGFCVLRHSRSDDILELKHQSKKIPDSVEAEVIDLTEEYSDHRNIEDSSYTDSPGVFSQEEIQSGNEDDADCTDSAVDDRISNIEEEYIQRIYGLEQRHYELEDVLARLAACLDEAFNDKKRDQETANTKSASSDEVTADKDGNDNVNGVKDEATEDTVTFHEKVGLELFVEFQDKLRNFASDLNGVLNCSEAAIRHARVVQQWATSVQIMFEQIKDERQKILNYIDERERSSLIVKEQFIAEFQEQGKQLQQLVDEMNCYTELREKADEYCKKKLEEEGPVRHLAGRIVEAVLLKRMEQEQSIMLSLNKQSKISELKLFIIHQQNCIQQLQEQNKELKAIIEGLMGPDDIEEEEELCDTDQSGTPASVSTPDHCPVREVLNKLEDSPLCLVSDVLYCDRGEYLTGTSTDGDIATIQTYNIGKDTDQIDSGEKVVFDPLSVSYVRQQCQLAEETERQIHKAENIVVEDLTTTDEGVKVIQDGIDAINIEPYLRKLAEEEDRLKKPVDHKDAAGDGIDKAVRTSPNKTEKITKTAINEKTIQEIPSIVVTPPSPENQTSTSVQ